MLFILMKKLRFDQQNLLLTRTFHESGIAARVTYSLVSCRALKSVSRPEDCDEVC